MDYINDIYAERGAAVRRALPAAVDGDRRRQGQYAAYGKDRDGVTQRLRADDGIHFTAAGYELIAEKIVGLIPVAAPDAK